MMQIDYTRVDERQLDELFERSTRLEEDFQRRLAARLDFPDLPEAHRASNLDPVAKRLWFLLAKVRNERRAVGRELAMRRRYGRLALRNIDELDFERRCTEEPPLIDDNVSARPVTWPVRPCRFIPSAVELVPRRRLAPKQAQRR